MCLCGNSIGICFHRERLRTWGEYMALFIFLGRCTLWETELTALASQPPSLEVPYLFFFLSELVGVLPCQRLARKKNRNQLLGAFEVITLISREFLSFQVCQRSFKAMSMTSKLDFLPSLPLKSWHLGTLSLRRLEPHRVYDFGERTPSVRWHLSVPCHVAWVQSIPFWVRTKQCPIWSYSTWECNGAFTWKFGQPGGTGDIYTVTMQERVMEMIFLLNTPCSNWWGCI